MIILKWLRLQIFVMILFVDASHSIQHHKSNKIKRLKIACVGDQVTVGNSETESYPYFLNQSLSQEQYEVKNFGLVNASIQDNTDKPYQKSD